MLRRTPGRLRRSSLCELRRVQRSRKRRIQPQGLRTHVKLHCGDRSRDGSEGGIFFPEAPRQLRGSSILRALETHPRKGATPSPYLGSNRNILGYPGRATNTPGTSSGKPLQVSHECEKYTRLSPYRDRLEPGIVTPILPIHRTTGGRDSGVTWKIGRLLAMVTTVVLCSR